MGWTSVALTADPWNIKREMFSLREKNFAFLQTDYITARPTVAAAHCPVSTASYFSRLFPHSAPSSVISHHCVGKKVQTRRNRPSSGPSAVSVPLRLSSACCAQDHVQEGLSRLVAWPPPGVHGGSQPTLPSPACFLMLDILSFLGLGLALPRGRLAASSLPERSSHLPAPVSPRAAWVGRSWESQGV